MAKNNVTNFRGDNFNTPSDKMRVKEEPVTPIEEDFGDHNYMEQSFENPYGSMRKSLSMNDIATLREDLVKLEFSERDDMYDRHRRVNGAPQELSRTKFVSMAEAIYHYHRDTPGRFHSSKPQLFKSQCTSSRQGLTVPQSPMLRCKTRARPLHIMSQKEKEELEVEEIKKFKIKANRIPKSVIEGPKHMPEVTKKPITIPEPFKLTELQKKQAQTPDQTLKFKARPAPKHILEKPQIPVKPPVQVTKPVSPKFHYKRVKSADYIKYDNKNYAQSACAAQKPIEKQVEKIQRHGPLRPEPFSFEKRDEQIKKRKEEWIRKQLEEEKRQATLFKAQPLPSAVKKQMHKVTAKGGSSTTSSENKENIVKFEARPPAVLYKEPFKPVLQPLQLLKTVPFELSTEKRAAEREIFDKLLKEKDEERERLRQQREKEQEEAEERLKAEMRAKLVHHAKPAPVPSAFIPEKSVAPLTVPETPKFIRRMKQN